MNSQFPPSMFFNEVPENSSKIKPHVFIKNLKDWIDQIDLGIRKASQRNGYLFESSFQEARATS